MRMAVLDGQSVVNVIDADEGFTLDGFELVQTDIAGPGWTYDGGKFSAPPEPPNDADPRELSLKAAGFSNDQVAAILAVMGG